MFASNILRFDFTSHRDTVVWRKKIQINSILFTCNSGNPLDIGVNFLSIQNSKFWSESDEVEESQSVRQDLIVSICPKESERQRHPIYMVYGLPSISLTNGLSDQRHFHCINANIKFLNEEILKSTIDGIFHFRNFLKLF